MYRQQLLICGTSVFVNIHVHTCGSAILMVHRSSWFVADPFSTVSYSARRCLMQLERTSEFE